jgi:hypothetical protein
MNVLQLEIAKKALKELSDKKVPGKITEHEIPAAEMKRMSKEATTWMLKKLRIALSELGAERYFFTGGSDGSIEIVIKWKKI